MGEHHIGQHVCRFEEPDFLVIELKGPMLPGQASSLARVHDAALIAQGRLFVLCDLRAGCEWSPSARAELKNRPKNLPHHSVAYVGVAPAVRIVLDMVVRGVQLFAKTKLTHRFFDDEHAARVWLASERPRKRTRPSMPAIA